MFQRFSRQFLLDLGELEGEYRTFHLKDDVRQSSFYIIIGAVSVLSMLVSDTALYRNRPDLFLWMMVSRVGFALFSVLVIIKI